jgi:hypothetical protein
MAAADDGALAMLTPADYERLGTWTTAIAAALLPGVAWRDEGDERRFVGQGGLLVNRRTGHWYSVSTRHGGGCLTLIEFLRKGNRADALRFAEEWLAAHDGIGDCGSDPDGYSRGSVNLAEDVRARMVPIAGTDAEKYLRSPHLKPPWPDCLGYLHDARLGDNAAVAAFDGGAGYQLTFLDPMGRKSTVAPLRRRYMFTPGESVSFTISSPPGGVADTLADLIICEGIEDGLAARQALAGHHVRIIAIPGCGTLKGLNIKKATRVVIVRDGDAPGSGADIALTKGIDRLLLDGAQVRVTPTPVDADANSILIADGPQALAELISKASPAQLSREGELERLSRMDPVDYEIERKTAAKRLLEGGRVSALDREIEKSASREGGGRRPARRQTLSCWMKMSTSELPSTPSSRSSSATS